MHTLLFREDPGPAFGLIATALLSICMQVRHAPLMCSVVLVVLVLFYRDEDRVVCDPAPSSVYSPSDGSVMACDDHEVVLFLSPLAMHTQKSPVNGSISHRTRRPGTFEPAYMLQKSKFNERVTTVFTSATCGDRIVVDQIAGQLARRIVGFHRVGKTLRAGQTFGMIKFSSQVRVRVPDGYTCDVREGDYVYAGRTVIFSKVLH